MRYFTLLSLPLLACTASSNPEDINPNLVGDSDRPAWNPDPQTISNESSSQNSVAWTPASDDGYQVDHYRLLSREIISGIETTVEIASSESEYTFTDLKSDSEYEHSITACLTEDCSEIAEVAVNDDDVENNYWLLKTAPERWTFFQNSSRSNFQVSFLNAKDPSILVFENTEGSDDGRVILSYTDTNTGSVHFGDVELPIQNPSDSLAVSTYVGQGLVPGLYLSHYTASQLKPFEHDGQLNMMMFFSFERTDESTHIGFISNARDFEIDFGGECSPLDGSNCAMQSCFASEEIDIGTLSSFHVAWESFGLDNMGAKEEPILIVEGRQTSQDEGSLFLASQQDGEWTLNSDENNYPRKWIRNAQKAAVLNYSPGYSKLYYQSTLNSSLNLLYWQADSTGETNVYDFDDLEDSSLARKIELIDAEGNALPEEMLERIGNYHIFTHPIDQKQYLLYTILHQDSPVGLGLAHLSNP